MNHAKTTVLKNARLFAISLILVNLPNCLMATTSFGGWNSGAVKLGSTQEQVVAAIGKPDKINGRTEVYVITDSPEVYVGLLEYSNGRISMYGQLCKPQVSMEMVEAKLMEQGIKRKSADKEGIFYFARIPGTDKDCFIRVTRPENPNSGPRITVRSAEENYIAAEKHVTDKPALETSGDLSDSDLKILCGSAVVEVDKDSKASIVKTLPGGHWEADATDGNGKPISMNIYKWKGCYAYFDKNDVFDGMMLGNGAVTHRGVAVGSPIPEIFKAYPGSYKTEYAKMGKLYVFEFVSKGRPRALMFETNTRKNTVINIFLRTS